LKRWLGFPFRMLGYLVALVGVGLFALGLGMVRRFGG
jgi:hypothetical protein